MTEPRPIAEHVLAYMGKKYVVLVHVPEDNAHDVTVHELPPRGGTRFVAIGVAAKRLVPMCPWSRSFRRAVERAICPVRA